MSNFMTESFSNPFFNDFYTASTLHAVETESETLSNDEKHSIFNYLCDFLSTIQDLSIEGIALLSNGLRIAKDFTLKASAASWSWTKQAASYIARTSVTLKDWSAKKFIAYKRVIAEQLSQLKGWTLNIALVYVERHARTAWTAIKSGYNSTTEALVVGYNWTSAKVISITKASWNMLTNAWDTITCFIGEVTDKLIHKLCDKACTFHAYWIIVFLPKGHTMPEATFLRNGSAGTIVRVAINSFQEHVLLEEKLLPIGAYTCGKWSAK